MPAQWPRSFRDDLGQEFTFEKPVQRIVSIAPAATEIVFALGLESRLVGVTDFCDYPPEATHKPHVGGYTDPSIEKIVALKPDVVLAMHGVPEDLVRRLESLGVSLFGLNPRSIQEVLQAIATIGDMGGADEATDKLVAQLGSRIEAVTARQQELPTKPRVLYVVDAQQGYVAGPGTFIDDIISRAGGTNIASEAQSEWPKLSPEFVLERDPQIIFTSLHHAQAGRSAEDPVGLFTKRAGWSQTSAVRAGHVVFIDDDLVTLPGPRLVDGLEVMARAISEVASRPPRSS